MRIISRTPCNGSDLSISMKWESIRTHRTMAPSTIAERDDGQRIEPVRSAYATPVLRALGDIREMTLGGSLGTGDSGNAAIQEV